MGNILFAEKNPLKNDADTDNNTNNNSNTFLFCYQDDNDIPHYYTLPLDSINAHPQMKYYIKKFLKYGNDLPLQCSAITGRYEDTALKEYPEWRFQGTALPESTFEDYVTLKRLIKSNWKSKSVNEQDAKKLTGPSLTIKMLICFASLSGCDSVRKSLVWE